MAAWPQWLGQHPTRATSTGPCQVYGPSASHHPSLASCLWSWWQQHPMRALAGPYCSLKAEKDLDCRVPPPLSGLWPSNPANPALSKPQPTAPPSFITCPWLQHPETPEGACLYGWGCDHVHLSLETLTVSFLPANMNSSLCCNPICFSYRDSCTSQLLLIPVPTATLFSNCCIHRG